MHPNTIKPFINMMLFSMMNGLTGTAFVECSDALLDLINLSMEPFGCSASPFKSKCIDNTVYRWSTEVIGPIMQGSTSVTLTVEIVPWAKRWQVFATFNPGNHGQSDIFDNLKDNNISGNQGSPKYTEDDLVLQLDGNTLEPRCTLFSKDTDRKQVAENMDELSVANVSDHGYVTLRNPAGDQFMLNAEEAISAIPELQV